MKPYITGTGDRLVLSLFANFQGLHLVAIGGHPDDTVYRDFKEFIFIHPDKAAAI
ncbi:MAG TPA: hypothetical protein VFQ67_06385 [Allosphingosinicella sp.]|nr:hypothetical protein [Allosphingosinicella sp.]